MRLEELIEKYHNVIDDETFEDYENAPEDRRVRQCIVEQINEHLEENGDYMIYVQNGTKDEYYKEEG